MLNEMLFLKCFLFLKKIKIKKKNRKRKRKAIKLNKILNGTRMMKLLVLLFMFKFYLYFFFIFLFFLNMHLSPIAPLFLWDLATYSVFFHTLSLAPLQPKNTFRSSCACVYGLIVNFRILPSLCGVCFHGCFEGK